MNTEMLKEAARLGYLDRFTLPRHRRLWNWLKQLRWPRYQKI